MTLDTVTVSDPGCDAPPAYASGDLNSDGELDVNETWTYTCSYAIDQADIDAGTVSNTASGRALGPNDVAGTADDATAATPPR